MRRAKSRLCLRRIVVRLARMLAIAVYLAATHSAQPQSVADSIVSRIERARVDSRGLAAVGYSKRLRALEIEFRRGGTYRYLGVPPSVHQELLAAESKARFYNTKVRGKYRSVFVRPRRKA